MKRRELIKNSLIAASAAFVGAAGCKTINSNYKTTPPHNDFNNLVPKQTRVYNIISPLPFRYDLIDEMKELNSQLKKSQIKTLYNSIPYPLSATFELQFQGARGQNVNIKSFNDFAKYVKYAQNLGFKFVYVLNSPRPFTENDLKKHEKSLFTLLDNLLNIGCNEIKVANHQLVMLLSEHRPQFNLSTSTSFEFHNISQYINLLNTYPNIKSINTSIDDNHNFIYLKNLRNRFPNIDIELMVNEKCIHGCPARISHPSTPFLCWQCEKLKEKIGALKYFCKGNFIYPWHLEYYSAIGINTFKFMSYTERAHMDSIDNFRNYLKCVEYGIHDFTAKDFFACIFGLLLDIDEKIMLSDIMPYLPDIKHFLKYGDKCANICDSECNYCVQCAEKLEKVLGV